MQESDKLRKYIDNVHLQTLFAQVVHKINWELYNIFAMLEDCTKNNY